MNAVADLPRDDDSPPPSGVRLRLAVEAPEAPASFEPTAPVSDVERHALAEALALVGEEVVLETWALVRALSPLQGAWLKLGLGQLGAAVFTAGAWHRGELRERWPELVPGYAAMDCLAGVMVDAIC